MMISKIKIIFLKKIYANTWLNVINYFYLSILLIFYKKIRRSIWILRNVFISNPLSFLFSRRHIYFQCFIHLYYKFLILIFFLDNFGSNCYWRMNDINMIAWHCHTRWVFNFPSVKVNHRFHSINRLSHMIVVSILLDCSKISMLKMLVCMDQKGIFTKCDGSSFEYNQKHKLWRILTDLYFSIYQIKKRI